MVLAFFQNKRLAFDLLHALHAKLSGAVYCNRSSLCVCAFVWGFVCLRFCYHDNLKLRASIFTKLGEGSDHLQLIKFWPSHAPGKGSAAGRNFWLRHTTASVWCLCLLRALFHLALFMFLVNANWMSLNYVHNCLDCCMYGFTDMTFLTSCCPVWAPGL